MKRALYFLAGIALFASCTGEPLDEPQSEAVKVPLNITVQTKAGGSEDGGSDQDIKSVRIVVFKNTGDASTDLIMLNEYYSFGFGVEDKTDKRYTVTVKPTLELDINTNLYYVYAVLNEDGYTLTDATVLSTALDEVANRSGMNTLLETKATYPSAGVVSAPYCLMSACKTVDFSSGRDLPIEVHFGMYEADATNPSPIDRTMAQITVESIKSIEGATNAALLSKVFVLDVDLVNVPSGIAWGVDGSGSPIPGSTTGGKTALPIGSAFDPEDGTTPYYKRIWDGNVYKQVDVNVNCEQRMTANYYRTTASDKTGWAFYDSEATIPIEKYVYAGTGALPTPVPPKPYGFPTLNAAGTKYVYYTWKEDKNPANCKNEKKEKGNNKYDEAYVEYCAKLPHDPATGLPVDSDEVATYNTYYTTNKTAIDAYYAGQMTAYNNAVTGLGAIDDKFNANDANKKSVYNLVNTQLPAIFEKKTYYSTDKYTISSVKSSQPTTYETYCTGDSWAVNLGDSYYVPENISSTFDQNTTTCIKVKLAVAAPDITLSGTADVTKLPVPENIQDDGATYTYWFDNYYYASAADYASGKLTKQVLPTTGANSTPTGAFNLTQTTDQPKIKVTQYDANGWKNVTDQNFKVVDLFKQNGRVVDADDETVPADSTSNNRFVVYIPGENFWRTGTGLTGTVTVDSEQEGSTFSWNIPNADNTSTTGFAEVKEFFIPVNNKKFNSDYSIRRNTKYTVKLTVGDNTYAGFTKASGPENDASGVAGLSITADVTAETLIEDEN